MTGICCPFFSCFFFSPIISDNMSLVSNRAESYTPHIGEPGEQTLQGSANSSVSEAPHDKTQVSVKKRGE